MKYFLPVVAFAATLLVGSCSPIFYPREGHPDERRERRDDDRRDRDRDRRDEDRRGE